MSDEDKRKVREDYFDIMDMSDFAKLCSIATEEVLTEGEIVAFQGRKESVCSYDRRGRIGCPEGWC